VIFNALFMISIAAVCLVLALIKLWDGNHGRSLFVLLAFAFVGFAIGGVRLARLRIERRSAA
jgi:hypothetical protein